MRILILIVLYGILAGCSSSTPEEIAINKHLARKNPSAKKNIKLITIQEVDTIKGFDSLAHILTVRTNQVIDKKNYSISQALLVQRKYKFRMDSSRIAYIIASRELDSLLKADVNSMDLFARRTYTTLRNFAVQNLNKTGESYDNDSITYKLIQSYASDSGKILSRVFETTFQLNSKKEQKSEFYLNADADSVLLAKPLK